MIKLLKYTQPFLIAKYITCYIILLSVLHLGVSYTYYEVCVPKTKLEILFHWMNLGSPVCLFINKVQVKLAEVYVFKWMTVMKSMFDFLTE